MAKQMTAEEIKNEAFALVEGEKTAYEDTIVWVTDQVAFQMRDQVRAFRERYWGIFADPIDPVTGREKTSVPLAQAVVEDVYKNIDLDLKDINYRANTPQNSVAVTEFVRAYVTDKLQKLHIGEKLDRTERQTLIDGTGIWKTWEEDGKLKVAIVDRLNVYLNPSADSIQEAERVTERALLTPKEVEAMDGWEDNEEIVGAPNLSKVDGDVMFSMNTQTVKMQDVWETWGLIPERLITGNPKDEQLVEGHIVISGLESRDRRVHLIEKNTKKDSEGNIIKPYEDVILGKMPGRYDGVGVVERIAAMHDWINEIINVRINRQRIAQLGLMKIKKGRGITAQMLKRLPVMGGIFVTDQDDITNFPIAEPGQTSYQDEANAEAWARKVTSTYPISTGELSGSQTATTSAILSRSATSSFTGIQETFGDFLKRWMDRHALPILGKGITKEDVIRFSTSEEFNDDLIERVAVNIVLEKTQQMLSLGQDVNPLQVTDEVNRVIEELRRGKDIFIENFKDIVIKGLETDIYITGETLDVPVKTNQLIQMLQLAPQDSEAILNELHDIMGIRMRRTPQPAMAQMQGENMPNPNMQQLTTQANVLPNAIR